MSQFSGRFRIGTRINALTVVLLILLAVVGTVGYRALSGLDHTFDDFVDRETGGLIELLEAERDFADLRGEVLAYSLASTDRDKSQEIINELNRSLTHNLGEIPGLVTDSGQKAGILSLLGEFKEYSRFLDALSAARRELPEAQGNQKIEALVKDSLQPLALKISDDFGQATEGYRAHIEAVKKQTDEKSALGEKELLFLIALSAILGLVASLAIGRGIVAPVTGMTAAMTRLAEGHTDIEVPGLEGRDEIADMGKAVIVFKQNAEKVAKQNAEIERQNSEKMLVAAKAEQATKEIGELIARAAGGDYTPRVQLEDKTGFLKEIGQKVNHLLDTSSHAFKDFGQKARQTAVSVGEASTAVSQVSDGARSQMSSLAQVASALTDSAKAIRIVSDSTKNASDKAIAASQFVKRGQTAVDQLMPIVEAIAQNSRKIDQIAQVISQIANRTHILSLNAAIEAARAGEHGKGFVVVAQEVGKLAESAGQNAKQIADIVERASSDAQEGKAATVSVRDVMTAIAGETEQTTHMIRSISVAMEEQQATITQIDSSVSQLRGIAASNSAASEEITATMIQLSQLANETRERLAQFKTA
ncbi:MAG: MCP four helix bundle domain-containing protein [Vicinamibacteria bacterium]|nr:MCP four helix bundle domain-containing protein [Vicinamibacteria bacterium]